MDHLLGKSIIRRIPGKVCSMIVCKKSYFTKDSKKESHRIYPSGHWKQAKTKRSAIQTNRSVHTQVSLESTPVSLNIGQVSLKKAQISLFTVRSQ